MIYLLVAVLAYLAFVLLVQRAVLFPHRLIEPPGPATPNGRYELLTLDTDAGPVEAMLRLGEGVSPDRPGPLVIFAHGNAELIDHNVDAMSPYLDAGVSVLLPEYRGYGRSAGKPSQKTITADFVAWRNRMLDRPEVDPDRVVYHGRSLGGGVAAQLAKAHPPRGLILESTFTSVKAMAANYLVPPFLVRDPFDTLKVVRRLDRPILVMHGTTDHIIPPSHADRLASAAKDAKRVHFEAGHNDPIPPEQYWPPILDYLRCIGVIDAEVTAVERL